MMTTAAARTERSVRGYRVSTRFTSLPGPRAPGSLSGAPRRDIDRRAREVRGRARGDVIHYKLSYKGLEGNVTQAHIHFGQRHTVGGIVVWLCQTAGAPAPTAPLTSARSRQCARSTEGTVTGTITPAQVLAVAGQGIRLAGHRAVRRARQSDPRRRDLRERSLDAVSARGDPRPGRRPQARRSRPLDSGGADARPAAAPLTSPALPLAHSSAATPGGERPPR